MFSSQSPKFAHFSCAIFTALVVACSSAAADDYPPEAEAPLPANAVRAVHDLTFNVYDMVVSDRALKTSLRDFLSGLKGVRVEENDLEFRIIFESDILFDFDKSNIRSDAEQTLKVVAQALVQFKDKKIRLLGFTDSKGSDSYNDKLSLKRAQSVKQWLQAQPETTTFNLVAEGKGEREPIAPNQNPDGTDNPDGRQKNRRVEIRIPK